MKKLKFIIPLLAFVTFSCEDYLGDNISPNSPSPAQVTPDLQIENAQVASYREVARNMNRLGNFFMNNWGINVNSFAATSPQEFSMSLDSNFYSSIWNNTYLNTSNFSTIINYPSNDYENHKAVAMILKSFYFQYIVDLYGDVPYFSIHQFSAELTPSYDNDEDVYRALYDQLNAAIAKIDNAPATIVPLGGEDAVFQGNMVEWKKFANTLKLRMMMRVSNSTNAAAIALFNDIQADLNLNQPAFLTADATINPGYNATLDTRQNPFYNQMYELNETTDKNAFRYFRASKYMGDQLNSTADPRRGRIFQLISGNVVGMVQGDTSQGSGGTAPTTISSLGSGIVASSAQDGYMMTAAESYFLQAEAAHEGYLTFGPSAQALFNSGIAASMAQLGVADGGYTAFINGSAGKGYGIGTPAQKLQAIMYQKNIALQGSVNAIESFIEHTRTGLIDTIPMAISGVIKPNKPRRLLYPNSEYVGNSANVPAQGDVFVTGPFWFN